MGIGNTLQNMVARCTVALSNAAGKMQQLQIRLLAGEVKSGVEHMEPYGFTSNPLAGAEGIAIFPGGDRSVGYVIVTTDRRYRIVGLEPGELAIYTHEGASIKLKNGRVIDVECDDYNVKAKKFTVTAEQQTLTATTLTINAANVDSSGKITAPDIVLADTSMVGHIHEEHDGPSTSKPI